MTDQPKPRVIGPITAALLKELEPQAAAYMTHEYVAGVRDPEPFEIACLSQAVSLKRIADAMEADKQAFMQQLTMAITDGLFHGLRSK